MKLREKLSERIQPALETGEQVQQVFQAQKGPNPHWIFLSFWTTLISKHFIVAVTDRAIITVRASTWVPTKPKSGESPIRSQLAPLGELAGAVYSKIEIGGQVFHVHRRFYGDVRAANEAIADGGPVTATAPSPPT